MAVMGIGYQIDFLKQQCLDFCWFVFVVFLFCCLSSVNGEYYRNHEDKFPRFLLKLMLPLTMGRLNSEEAQPGHLSS